MAKSIRDAYGEALASLGRENEAVVVLDADVSGSTKSRLFAAACPGRFFNVGIAEANMSAMAAGMASCGKVPFVNTFAVFAASNGLLAARSLASYSNLPVKFAGAYSGMSDAYDGPSHHALEDIAVMRALPNFQVLVPCDASQTAWAVQHAAENNCPTYLRLSRDVFPDIYPERTEFQVGKGRVVRQGRDITVIACGLMLGHALTAADRLAQEGVSVRVVDMFCVKPLDEALILSCARETGAIVSAEEHSVIGGLGGAVAEALGRGNARVPMGFVGVNDCHGECGPYHRLQEQYGFDAGAVVGQIRATLEKKRTIL